MKFDVSFQQVLGIHVLVYISVPGDRACDTERLGKIPLCKTLWKAVS